MDPPLAAPPPPAKKKRGGKKKKPLKDHGEAYDDNELLSEEITALCAIFQDDCKVVSGSQPQIIIKLRPHSKTWATRILIVSALLLVRCLPGYPNKCPMLQITPEKGLSTTDADNLLALINDQANSNAREGRLMIFNLVEAAQEFLSEISPQVFESNLPTLRQVFESYSHFDKELAWHLFRQTVEGLAHIHGQGIIHRDLTLKNIFFDARNDIKIGDFGLAKFLKLEQLDQDPSPADTTGVSLDGTGQVGPYFYTAPEIEQGWPKIDEKADMYSLGILFFELWHPFGTAMERHLVLSDLKQKGVLHAAWVSEFPEQASLLRNLMSPSPSDRPSATELIKHAFPPRMESELLNNILRTMQTSEDRNVYDKVLNAIFDEEMLSLKDQQHHDGRSRLAGSDTSAIQYADLYTEARDYVVEITREVFRKHCTKHLEVIPIRLLDDCPHFMSNTVKLLTHGGDMLELLHELRLHFVSWVISNQKPSFKRYEISCVYRRPIGHASPSRYLQGDFDIIGGASALTEAEAIKVMHCYIYFFCGLLSVLHGWI
ncbi:LOW QUALITY PROTEIN: eIF-2-alpha kinase GCN2-like [Argentina anserina]|uniref:LOW QUALITY PROTEIN: eIF-2-alpha kinase GCN2-like n=1 Tax=Argentina anserina TaxID=57926 RepID=UPI00217625BB|nr:LOW QUALITY PROTEIN: eIF-2-alpha kinase GCN2-like [Potentilla anserina]